jgi:hypothetical protein
LVDQGTADTFLDDGLRPWLLRDACAMAGIPLTLNMRKGYDHSYFFISTFMELHIRWQCATLSRLRSSGRRQDKFARKQRTRAGSHTSQSIEGGIAEHMIGRSCVLTTKRIGLSVLA